MCTHSMISQYTARDSTCTIKVSAALYIDNYISTFPDGDIEVESYNRTYTIRINETEVEVDAITIVDDTIPETDEGFTLSLMKGDGSDTLNFFPSISVATITIVDDDGMLNPIYFAEQNIPCS